MSKITLVSCLYDLASRQAGTSHRTVDQLLEWSDPVLSLDRDLIIYVDPGLKGELDERRYKKGLTDRTKVVVKPLEDLKHSQDWLNRIKFGQLPQNRSLVKDTPNMLFMGWSKPGLMAHVANWNPFDATHIGWIDLGISHAGVFPILPEARPFDDLPSKMRFHHLYPFDREMFLKNDFWDSLHGLVAAGWMVGDLEHVRMFEKEFQLEVELLLARGKATIDEDIIASVIAKNPGNYESRYGRYPDLLNTRANLLALVMMVKNESERIKATLESVKPWIDTYAILDTGSTDGTQDIIRKELEGIPGFLDEEPIKTYEDTGLIDYAESRNRGLELAEKANAEFYLLLNGDDFLHGGDKLREHCQRLRGEQHGGYWIRLVGEGGGEYTSTRLTRASAKWRYHMPTHEVLSGQGHVPFILDGVHIKHLEDSWETRINRWHRDEKILTRYLQKNPNDQRATFYLAQTHECLTSDGGTDERIQHLIKACEFYRARAALLGWIEEAYEAKRREAGCAKRLGRPWMEVQQLYLDAHSMMPHRMEPLWHIAQHWHEQDNHALTYLFGLRGLNVPFPKNDALGVDRDVYEWRLADLVGIHAFYLGEKAIGERAARKAVNARPHDGRLQHNLAFYAVPAQSLFSGFRTKELVLKDVEPYHSTNPSVMVDGDRRCGVVRTVNYHIVDGCYHWPTEDHAILTRNYWAEFDKDWNLTLQKEILDKTSAPRTDYPVHGYEDCRLFSFGGSDYMSAVSCDLRYLKEKEGARDQVMLRLDDQHDIVGMMLLHGEFSTLHQKNWMPWVHDQDLYLNPEWVYSTDPFVVAKPDVKTDIKWNGEVKLDGPIDNQSRLRGGSQVIKTPYGWFWLVHEVSANQDGRGRIYLHRFVWSSTGAKVDAISPPFYLKELGIEFAAGLALDGDQLVASFGLRDIESHLGFFPLSQVLQLMERSLV